jgi:parvulin-like peptidyl-prolyl isomerase
MRLNRRTNLLILWILAGALVLGMVITFTPTMGLGTRGADGAPAVLVNGAPISELAVVRTRSNPLFNLVNEGEVGADLELLLIDELVRQELIRQEASRQRVSNAEVRTAVEEFRVSRGVAGRANDSQYLSAIGSLGFTDETFRAYLAQQLRQEKWQAEIIDGVSVSEEEVQAYFDANRDLYQTEERILARQIVVASRDEAEAIRAELIAGGDAATIARERSLERAERDGALGAGVDETEPRPVGRPALPTAVATAAFGIRGPGITDVIEVAGQYHLVVVEEFLPTARRPFEEVADVVREDALEAKQAQALDEAIRRLTREARVEIPPPNALGLRYDEAVVATVGDAEIRRSELVRATYTNPQIQQALSPDTAFLITGFFKPAILDQLIDQELAYQGSDRLGVPFVGPRRFVAQNALEYVARDVSVSEEEIEAFYQENLQAYTVAASAAVSRVDFADVDAAEGFRVAVLDGSPVEEALAAFGGTLASLGTVRPGQLEPDLDTAVFATDAFDPLAEGGEISDVLVLMTQPETLPEELEDAGEEAEPAQEVDVVVLLADRTPERVRPLAEVRSQVENAILSERRAEERTAWLEELRASIPVVNHLADAGLDEGAFGVPGFTFDETEFDELEEALESREDGSEAPLDEGDGVQDDGGPPDATDEGDEGRDDAAPQD